MQLRLSQDIILLNRGRSKLYCIRPNGSVFGLTDAPVKVGGKGIHIAEYVTQENYEENQVDGKPC